MRMNINKVKLAQANECLSVNELVKKTGLGRATVSKTINGMSKPSIKTLGLIAKALNVNVEDIIDDWYVSYEKKWEFIGGVKMDINEYREKIKKKTINTKELAAVLGVSEAKARRITHIEGAPVLKIGRDIRIIVAKLDEFLEEHIGEVL